MMRMRLKPLSAKMLCAALLILVAVQARVVAAPLVNFAQYRQNVREAIERLDALALLCERISAAERRDSSQPDPEANVLPPLLPDTETETTREVSRLLAPAMKVEWNGQILEVNNAWLHTALEEYRQESASSADNQLRATTIREIIERLRGLDERLAEVESASAESAPARDREADKGRLAAILRSPEFNKQGSRGGALSNLLKQLMESVWGLVEQLLEWIRSLFPNIGLGGGRGISSAAQIFIFTLALGVIAFIIRRHWLKHGGKLKRVSIREARVVLGEHLAPDQTAADLLAESERLARTGDLRGAIRKAYVALLCELGDRKIIRLAQHKTNRDYLQAVHKLATPQLYQEMQPLTFSYERHWYGFEQATETDWTDFVARCRRALNMK